MTTENQAPEGGPAAIWHNAALGDFTTRDPGDELGWTEYRAALAAQSAQEAVAPRHSYLAGHADGLEWAACLVAQDDPRTGDWMHDDRSDLAAAIRKGPEMPDAEPLCDDQATWCGYVAGMVAAYLDIDSEDERVPVMAKVIERRLWALPTRAAPASAEGDRTWNHTTAELAAIYGEMAAINETAAKDQSAAQKDRLRALRAEAVAIGERRFALVAASKVQPKGTEVGDPNGPTVEAWHGDRKVTIYPHSTVLCMQYNGGTATERLDCEFVSDVPHTLDSAQAAFDWLYRATPDRPTYHLSAEEKAVIRKALRRSVTIIDEPAATQAPAPAPALLVQALEDIIEPFAYIERNLPEGYRLDGQAALQQISSREFYTRIAKEALAAHRAAVEAPAVGATKPPKHTFWGAGEADCPADIKAPNGELHNRRCKVCGETNPPDQFCWPKAPTHV